MGTTEWLLRLFVFGAFYSWTHFRICHIDKKAELTITALVCVTRLMKIVFNYLKYHLTSSLLCIWLLCGGAYLSVYYIGSVDARSSRFVPFRLFASYFHGEIYGKIEINFNETELGVRVSSTKEWTVLTSFRFQRQCILGERNSLSPSDRFLFLF